MPDTFNQHSVLNERCWIVENISSYILSVVAAATLCTCISLLPGKGWGSGKMITAVCGVYMVFVMIAPLKNFDFSIYTDYFSGLNEKVQEAVSDGKDAANDSLAEIIIEETEAYILDKAASMGADISVEIKLDTGSPPVPSRITIKGAVSPYVKRMLTQYIINQLGIPKEAQSWG